MLSEIRIRNLGVIAAAQAEFVPGLTVVTGETGAGKTMVVSSLRLLSGARADASRVRNGSDKAVVEGIVQTRSPRVAEVLEDIGGFSDEVDGDLKEIIASRAVTAQGRSRAHLGGKSVAAGVLSEFAAQVLTIHGQNDQLRLLDASRQMRALDEFAGLKADVADYRKKQRAYRTAFNDLQRRLRDRRELSLEAETLTRALEAIDALDPSPGEDEQVKSRIRDLQDADDRRVAIEQALAQLDGSAAPVSGDYGYDMTGDMSIDSESAVSLITRASEELSRQSSDSPSAAALADIAERLDALAMELTDISADLGRALLDVPDPAELETLLSRQRELKGLRKYGADIDAVLAWRDDARSRLATIDVSDDVIAALTETVTAAEAAAREAGTALSQRRRAAAVAFAEAVSNEIRGLHMAAALHVDLTSTEELGADGMDAVEFQLVQGGVAKPLAGSASGGELSRIMLALEVILADSTHQQGERRTLVFDEVDAGVGGKAAVEIGRRLAALARQNQVIVVTHLPQVAAFADAHLTVSKEVSESSVESSLVALTTEQRIEELARMLAGLESETGRAHAEELLEMATQAKHEQS